MHNSKHHNEGLDGREPLKLNGGTEMGSKPAYEEQYTDDQRQLANHIIGLEKAALDKWFKGGHFRIPRAVVQEEFQLL